MRNGDLVKRVAVSSILINRNHWDVPDETIMLVTRGLHEGSVYWAENVTSLGIVIDVMNPATGRIYREQPSEDFIKVG